MTYGELSKTKTNGFTTNHVIDDVVNNARWAFGRNAFADQVVSEHEIQQIRNWAAKEGVSL
jgi:hypothetical protein